MKYKKAIVLIITISIFISNSIFNSNAYSQTKQLTKSEELSPYLIKSIHNNLDYNEWSKADISYIKNLNLENKNIKTKETLEIEISLIQLELSILKKQFEKTVSGAKLYNPYIVGAMHVLSSGYEVRINIIDNVFIKKNNELPYYELTTNWGDKKTKNVKYNYDDMNIQHEKLQTSYNYIKSVLNEDVENLPSLKKITSTGILKDKNIYIFPYSNDVELGNIQAINTTFEKERIRLNMHPNIGKVPKDEEERMIKSVLYHEIGHLYSIEKMKSSHNDTDFLTSKQLIDSDFVKNYKNTYSNFAMIETKDNNLMLEEIAVEISILMSKELNAKLATFKRGIYFSQPQLIKEMIAQDNSNLVKNKKDILNVGIKTNSEIKYTNEEHIDDITGHKSIIIKSTTPIIEVEAENIPTKNPIDIKIYKISEDDTFTFLKKEDKNGIVYNKNQSLKNKHLYKLQSNSKYRMKITVQDGLNFKDIVYKDIITVS